MVAYSRTEAVAAVLNEMEPEMEEMTHSPLPWTAAIEPDAVVIRDAEGRMVLYWRRSLHDDETARQKSDADLIVTAVNAHEKMRQALKKIARKPIGAYDGARVREIARAALLAGEG